MECVEHHTLEMLFFSWNQGFSRGAGNNEDLQIPANGGAKPSSAKNENLLAWRRRHLQINKEFVSPKQDQGIEITQN